MDEVTTPEDMSDRATTAYGKVTLSKAFEALTVNQSPTLGAHTHDHGFWVGMGAILLFTGGHGWAWLRYYCSCVGMDSIL